MNALKDFKRLTTLTLSGDGVTDATLKGLKGLRQLTLLNLRLSKVTAAGVAGLKESLPAWTVTTAP